MIMGAPPFVEPSKFDIGFSMIINGKLDQMLKNWGKRKYISPSLLKLLTQMLCYDEDKRIDIVETKNHEWFKSSENINIQNEETFNLAKTAIIESNTSNGDNDAWIATIE